MNGNQGMVVAAYNFMIMLYKITYKKDDFLQP